MTIKKTVIQKYKKWAIYLFLLLLSFLIIMQSNNTIWHKGDIGTDSTVFKYVAYEIQKGHMPYLDSFDHKGPLIYLINVIGNTIDPWIGIWFVELVSMYVGLLYIFKTAKLYCNNRISVIQTFLISGCIFKYFEGGNLVEEYAIPFIAIGIYLFQKFFCGYEMKKSDYAACGGAFSCILLLRPNMGILWPVMCISIVIKLLREHKYKALIYDIKWFLLGMGIILIPILSWLALRGAMASFVESYFRYNVVYTKAMSTTFSRYQSFSYYFSDSIMTIATMAILLIVLIKHRIRDVAYACFFFLNIVLISMAGKISMHYGMIVVPTLIYPMTVIASELNKITRDKGTLAGVSAVIYLCIAPYILPGWSSAIVNTIEQFPGRNYSDYISASNKQIADLVLQHSAGDDEITVCGNWNIIYLLSNRCSSSRYSYQTVCSIDKEMEDEYFDDLINNPPSVIVLRSDFYAMDRMKDYLDNNSYNDVGGDDGGVARVLVRSNRN